MRCPKCGCFLPEDSLFCQYCGASLAVSQHSETGVDVRDADAPVAIPSDAPISIPVDAPAHISSPADSPSDASGPASAGIPLYDSPAIPAGTSPDITADTPADTASLLPDAPAAASVEAPPTGNVLDETRRDAEGGAKKQAHCKKCGAVIDSRTKRCSGCGKQYFRAKAVVPLLVCCVLLVLSLSLNGVQYFLGRQSAQALADQTSELEALEQEVSDLNTTVANQKSTILSQTDQVSLFKERAEYFDFLCQELSTGNIGYASEEFRASEGVIVVSLHDNNRKFTLNTLWSGGGTVSTSYSGLGATVSFDNDTWSSSTQMTVEPWRAGVTAVTFSNDANFQSFKVIIIVTD